MNLARRDLRILKPPCGVICVDLQHYLVVFLREHDPKKLVVGLLRQPMINSVLPLFKKYLKLTAFVQFLSFIFTDKMPFQYTGVVLVLSLVSALLIQAKSVKRSIRIFLLSKFLLILSCSVVVIFSHIYLALVFEMEAKYAAF